MFAITFPDGDNQLWDAERAELHRLIADLDPTLAGMYRQAMTLMGNRAEVGEEKARLSLVGHCFRELMNGLPDALRNAGGEPLRGLNNDREAREVAKMYEDVFGVTTEQPRVEEEEAEPQRDDFMAVPRSLINSVERFTISFREGETRGKQRDSITVLGRNDPSDAAIRPWAAARKFFMAWVHIDRHRDVEPSLGSVLSDSEVLEHIGIIEASLRVRLGAFFDNLRSLDDLIAEANRVHVPTKEQVHRVLARLGTLQFRRAFYAKLANPLWVAALRAEGVFLNPPAMEMMADGSHRVDPWPEIDYLVRMASLAPQEVAEVLAVAGRSDNPWVRRGIWEAASNLPAKDAAILVPVMKKWPDQDLANSRTDPPDISRVIVRLLEGGEYKKGDQLANLYYEPQSSPRASEIDFPEPRTGIEPYWYAETLPSVSAALGNRRLKTLKRWLEKYQIAAKLFDPDSATDTSYIWRPFIRDPGADGAHDIGDALVEAVRSAFIDAIQTTPRSLDMLLKSKQPLLRRIALDVLTEAIDEVVSASTEADDSARERRDILASTAASVLGDASYAEQDFRPEYVRLVQASAAWPEAINLQPLIGIVESGPAALRDSRRSCLAREGDSEEQIEERAEEYLVCWQHWLLAAIGKDSLPTKLKDRLVEFDSKNGVIDKPIQPVWQISSFTGPRSPLGVDSIRSMSDDELIVHLRGWHPDSNMWEGPSHEGQGRVLSDVLASEPGRLAARFEEIKTLRPTYIRAVVRGWQLALEDGHELPWDVVLRLCEWASNLSDSERLPSEGHEFDGDPDFRNLKFQVLQLLEAGFRTPTANGRPALPESAAESVEAMLSIFASHPEPSPGHKERYGGTNMDPFTLSLNTLRPVAIRTLIRLVHSFPGSPASIDALAVLEKHIGDGDPSTSVAATLGEGAGRLYNSARTWIKAHAAEIFGDAEPTTTKQQVALSTALAVHSVHPVLLELLRAPLLTALKEASTVSHALGWRGRRSYDQLIGDWILMGYITGGIDYEDELMTAWAANSGAELRGDVLGHVGWLLLDRSDVANETLMRVCNLWDARASHVVEHPEDAAELAHFYWYVRSGKFEVSWWLPRLRDVVVTVPKFQPRGTLGEQLAEAARVDPATALAVVEILLRDIGIDGESHHDPTKYDLTKNAAPQVIASALDTGQTQLVKSAGDLLNKLGAAGQSDLEERVTSRRKRAEHE